MNVLVVNAGSSSLKLSVLDGDELVWSGSEPRDADRVDAVGHRIVHGGTDGSSSDDAQSQIPTPRVQ